MVFQTYQNLYKINNNLCQQCGACIAICPQKAIKYEIANNGLMNLNILEEKCIKCGRCKQICPANKDTSLSDIKQYCKQKQYYLGYNKNNEIRINSSSGGFTRTVIIEGLKNGVFDGVYTLRKINEYPFAEGFFYTKDTIPSYNDIPNSIYHSIPLNLKMREITKCDKILIVGTTCQLLALSQYLKNKCKKIYTLCIFCKQQKSFESTKFIAKLSGINLKKFNDIESFSYRGNGWPGYCSFNRKKIAWEKAALMPFGKKLWMVPGCNICGNPFGIDVDITTLDPWIIEKNNAGKNLIIIHSEKGKEILNHIPNLILEKKQITDIEKSLMYDDIIKKNKFIPYFKGCTNDTQLISIGKSIEKQRRYLQLFLMRFPKLPFIIYKILSRLIKDKR
jgi:coenzyme F420-reducing hydrogenase beta subunit